MNVVAVVTVLAASLAEPDYGWAYVIIGWTLTAVVLAAYLGWVVARIRRAQRSLPPESDQ